jgi:hypothetical protein
VVVGQLKLFTNVLPPSWVQGHQFREEVSSHRPFDHVGIMERLFIVISFHSSACSFHVFAIVDQNLVKFLVLIRNLLPIVDDSSPVDDGSISEEFRHWEHPSMSLPSNIGNWILNKPEEVFKSPLFVALINALLSKSELLQLPIILFSHGSTSRHTLPISHLESLQTIRRAIVHVVIAMIS